MDIDSVSSPGRGSGHHMWWTPVSDLTQREEPLAWVIGRQAAIYHEEYGWDGTFEALLADIGATFIRDFEPSRERCRIAVLDGAPVGAVFLCPQSDEVARPRMLHAEAAARGQGRDMGYLLKILQSQRATDTAKVFWSRRSQAV